MMEPEEALANAIILQAVKDYRVAMKKLRKRPKNESAKLMVSDCEAFFRSEWFKDLTNLNGEVLLKRLREENE